jgi:hypothetical protein
MNDLMTIINDWLQLVGFDNGFGQTFLVLSTMALFSILLGIYKAPFIVMIIVNVALLLMFTGFGFIPVWIILVLGIGVVLLGFMTLKGGTAT